MVVSTPSLIIRAIKEPARDREKQEITERGGNITTDETVSIAQHMRHRAVAEDLSGTSIRPNSCPICELPCSWLPTSQQQDDISCVVGNQLVKGHRGKSSNNYLTTTITNVKAQMTFQV